ESVMDEGVQVAEVTIRGGYHPDRIRLVPGVPTRLSITRSEDGACSERLMIPDLGVDLAVPAYGAAEVELPAMEPGQREEFTCGMGMLHGTLEVSVDGGSAAQPEPEGDAEEQERAAEITDLRRR